LVWSDEFNYEGLPDSSKWSYDLGDGCPHVCGWGNNEAQYYTDKASNARSNGRYLVIEAKKEELGGKSYTSARLLSRGKGDWTYGKFVIRAKVPKGRGIWPAIWMLPTDNTYGGWPKSGEIDMMEHVGYEDSTLYGTVHTQAFNHMIGTQKSNEIVLKDIEETFHLYSIHWKKDRIEFWVDDSHYGTFYKEEGDYKEWPFDQAFHLILNVAVGGNWGGKYGIDDTIFPQQMLVDYVRVYQEK